ncbi:hypothetical protein [Nocardioides sp.]|jgi:hypothetical protein|uniref:hypothetical protein n=1 Tax=Nocardioides sp. TaxID=35761 RepID=UPI0031FEDB8D|nr:hypothetical protein [Nocardioides sp.]
MKRTTVLPALILALGIAVTGCGGGSDDKTSAADPTPSAISKADFTTQADAICTAGNKTIEEATAALGDNTSQADIAAFVTETMIPSVQGQHDAIAALGAPAGDEDKVAAILDALQSGIDALKTDPGAITTAAGSPFADANRLAADYGLTVCGAS